MKASTSSSKLEKVEILFSEWRQNRKNKTSPIPEKLLQYAAKLFKYYNSNTISRCLKLSGTRMKNLKKQFYNQPNNISEPKLQNVNNKFCTAAISTDIPMQSNLCKIYITGKNKQLIIEASSIDLNNLLPNLLREL